MACGGDDEATSNSRVSEDETPPVVGSDDDTSADDDSVAGDDDTSQPGDSFLPIYEGDGRLVGSACGDEMLVLEGGQWSLLENIYGPMTFCFPVGNLGHVFYRVSAGGSWIYTYAGGTFTDLGFPELLDSSTLTTLNFFDLSNAHVDTFALDAGSWVDLGSISPAGDFVALYDGIVFSFVDECVYRFTTEQAETPLFCLENHPLADDAQFGLTIDDIKYFGDDDIWIILRKTGDGLPVYLVHWDGATFDYTSDPIPGDAGGDDVSVLDFDFSSPDHGVALFDLSYDGDMGTEHIIYEFELIDGQWVGIDVPAPTAYADLYEYEVVEFLLRSGTAVSPNELWFAGWGHLQDDFDTDIWLNYFVQRIDGEYRFWHMPGNYDVGVGSVFRDVKVRPAS